jgi:hypothetical protein
MLGQTEGYTPCTTSQGQPGVAFPDSETCYPLEEPEGPLPGPDYPGAPPPRPGLPPDFVAPGPTELHPERWDLDACLYTVAYGDTYVGIAKTYLDPSGVRWREIWNLNRAQHPNPDVIYPGQVIQMTDEACDNMRRWVDRGQPGVNPSQIGPPTVADKARRYWPWALGAALLGGGLYYMS